MKPDDPLLFRRAILLQLEAASPASLPVETLRMGLSLAGFNDEPRSVMAALDYLREKNFVALQRSAISASSVRVKLLADGRDYLEAGIF